MIQVLTKKGTDNLFAKSNSKQYLKCTVQTWEQIGTRVFRNRNFSSTQTGKPKDGHVRVTIT